MNDNISTLLQRRTDLANQLESFIDSPVQFGQTEREISELDEKIARKRRLQAVARGTARPYGSPALEPEAPPPPNEMLRFKETREFRRSSWGMRDYVAHARAVTGFNVDQDQHFRSFGEYLVAVARHFRGTHGMDNRLVRAPAGAGESDASAGGFLVQSDFASAVWTRAYDMGELLSRVFKLPISANANGIKLPAIDETSRATGSRWGGVQSYWLAEGNSPTATKPKFRLIDLDLKKLFSLMYVSDDMLSDQTALDSIATTAFTEEITFMTEDGIFEGDGVGKPSGILNSPCLVTVPIDSGQAKGSITLNNILNMWSRLWIRSRPNAVWLINQDVEAQLYQLSQTVGTGGLPMFLPAGGLNQAPYSTLFGRPIIPIEYAQTLGTPGDIMLADLSQYVLADKRGMQAATSMHVRFLTDEMTFRFTYRVDGSPLWNAALVPFKGSNTKSPFIVLAQR